MDDNRKTTWTYDEAFCRHRGIISPSEQDRLRKSRVAIAGMGGIGGVDLVTLARLGVGAFTIADPDCFETANINRQYGANRYTLGANKAQTMARLAWEINPELDIRVFTRPLGADNAAEFLEGADVFVDAIEVFEMDARRILFRQAAANKIWGLTAGPIGFSAVWLAFDPAGMTFDQYFDLSDEMDQIEKLAAFLVGVAPMATQRAYVDLRSVDVENRTGPSSGLACQIASGALACEVAKILLGRGKVRAAPHHSQFDPFAGRFIQGRLLSGNSDPCQQDERRALVKMLREQMNPPSADGLSDDVNRP